MTVSEALHQIQYVLLSIPAEHRAFTLYAGRQSFDSNTGDMVPVSKDMDRAIHCVDCPHRLGKCTVGCVYGDNPK